MADFRGAEANTLAMRALRDPDPQVQAKVVPQLRSRNIPGTLSVLLELVESPYDVVRRAAREALAEFSFKRYLATFEMLDAEVRRSTGLLVKRIDPHTVPLLREELKSPMRTRRLRGLAVAQAIEAVEVLEPLVIDLLEDEDHMVRVEAATTLGLAASPAGRGGTPKGAGRLVRGCPRGRPSQHPNVTRDLRTSTKMNRKTRYCVPLLVPKPCCDSAGQCTACVQAVAHAFCWTL